MGLRPAVRPILPMLDLEDRGSCARESKYEEEAAEEQTGEISYGLTVAR